MTKKPTKTDKQKTRERTNKNLKPIKKGESRNPYGRPVGSKNRATILKEFLSLVVLDKNGLPVPNPLDKKQNKINYEQAVIARLIQKATNGDIKAIREVLDTMYGKIKEDIQITEGVKIIRDDIPDDC